MNAIDPEEMAGDYVDYVHADRTGLTAAGGWAAGKTTADLEQHHADLVTAFEALAAEFGRDGSHYHRDRVLAVLKESS